MKQNKNSHKPFTKPFWVLLASAIGCLALVYGGVVWATFSDAAECSGANRINCIKLGVKNSLSTDGKRGDKRTTDELATEGNKRLQFTNERTDKEYFVPLKASAERAAFLNAANGLGVDVCVAGEAKTSPVSVAGVSIEGCDTYDWLPGPWSTCGSGGGICSGTYTTSSGQCVGTVNGSTTVSGDYPGPNEGLNCSNFSTQSNCNQGWPTHGCQWHGANSSSNSCDVFSQSNCNDTSGCSWDSASSFKFITVNCSDGNGNFVDSSNCTTSKPVHKESCLLTYSGVGKGRIARALAEKFISLSPRQPTLISLSHTIEANR
jgi:hypothetical protein